MNETKRLTPEEAAEICHSRCRASQKIGPFAACACRCGGLSHGSETLRTMTGAARARAEQQMRREVAEGKMLMEVRMYLARLKKDWKVRRVA